MALKVGMQQHRVLEYNHICSNDDSGLTLTYFMARSNLASYAFVWEKGNIMDFSETVVVYDVKVFIFMQLNAYMNLCEYQRLRLFNDLRPMSLSFNIFKLLCSETARSIEAKFHMDPPWGVRNEGFVQMFQVTWPCPYMVKNFKNLLLRNQEADDLETGIQHRVHEYYQCFHMMTMGWPWPFLWQGQIFFQMFLHGWKLI